MSGVSNQVIKPIEELISIGLVQRLQQVFDCASIITTSVDRRKNLQRLFEGKPVSYPFLFATPSSYSFNTESYSSNRLARRGLEFNPNPSLDQVQTVRMLPAKLEYEIEYTTDRAFGRDSITWFAKRWLFAYRNGYMKFNIDYGRLALKIDVTMSENVPIVPRENVLDQESVYVCTNSLTVNGWISEEHIGEKGVLNRIDMDVETRPQNDRQSFWSFPESS